EIAHQGVVDGGLGARLPGLAGLGVAGIGADQLDLRQVAEFDPAEGLQLTPDDDVQQLAIFNDGVGHGRISNWSEGYCASGIGAQRRTINGWSAGAAQTRLAWRGSGRLKRQ